MNPSEPRITESEWLEELVKAEIQHIPKNALTAIQIAEKLGMGKTSTRNFIKRQVEKGTMTIVKYRVGSSLVPHYIPKKGKG